MTADTRVTVRVSRHFKASAERVFDGWLDPVNAGKWLFATPNGEMVTTEIDARVGGAFRFVDRRDGVNVEHVGHYEVLERPRRLVFSFKVPAYSDEATQVSIDIAPVGTGCELTLIHMGVLPDFGERTQQGWTTLIAGLAGTLGEA